MHALMRYPGSKWSLTEWIISRFPEHHSYLEPFFGSGAVVLSGYESEMYEERLRGWHREEMGSYTHSGTKKQEVLWMNFEPERQIRMEFDNGGEWYETVSQMSQEF